MFFLANKEIQMWDTEKKVKERNLNRKQKINTPNILCYPIFGEIRVDFVNSLMLRLKKKNKCLRWYCTQYKCAKQNRMANERFIAFCHSFFFRFSVSIHCDFSTQQKKEENCFNTNDSRFPWHLQREWERERETVSKTRTTYAKLPDSKGES